MKKNLSFLKSFTHVGIGTIGSMVIGFITTPIVTNLVNPDIYGKYSIFTLYASISLMVLCLGLDQALIRFYYRDDSLDYKRSLLKECIFYPLILTVVFGIIIFLLSFYQIIHLDFGPTFILLLTACVFFEIINRIDLILLRVSYQTSFYAVLQVSYKALFLCFALVGCFFSNFDKLYILVFSSLIAYFFVAISGVLFQKSLWNFGRIKKCNGLLNKKELYSYSLPFILIMGITSLFQAIDKLSLKHYCSYDEVGIYSCAINLVHIFAIAQTTFNALWMPIATEHYEKDPHDKSLYLKGNRIICLIMFFIGFSLIFSKELIVLILGEKYRAASYILPFLIFMPIMYTISETTVIGLVFKKKSNIQIIVVTLACLTNIIGNIILVPLYAGKGAAISTGISYIVFFFARTYFAGRYYYVNWHLTRFVIITALAVAYSLYNTFFQYNIFSVIGYIIAVVLLFVLYHDAVKEILFLSKNVLNSIKNRFCFS